MRVFWRLTAQVAGAVLLTAAGVLLGLSVSGAGFCYDLFMWGILPLWGALSAFFITRAGLTGYAAWFLPALCQTAAHWLMLGYPPQSAGMPFLTAGVSLVAAAAAEVVKERRGLSKRQK